MAIKYRWIEAKVHNDSCGPQTNAFQGKSDEKYEPQDLERPS